LFSLSAENIPEKAPSDILQTLMAARQFVAKSPRLAHPDNNLIQLPQPEKSKSYEIQQTLKAAKEFAEQNKKNIHLTPNMI
jgi:hypothetical protein